MEEKDYSVGVVPVYVGGDEPQYCLVKHKDGHWGFPKGHPEEGENEKNAALRELMEETGITDINFYDKTFEESYSYVRGGIGYRKQVKYFIGKTKDTKTKDFYGDEITEVCYLPYEEAQKRITYEESRKILEEAKNVIV